MEISVGAFLAPACGDYRGSYRSIPPREPSLNAETQLPFHGDGADLRTELGLLALPFIWGINFPLIKLALTEIPPLAFNALRFPLAAGTLWVFLRLGRGIRRPRRDDVLRLAALGIWGNVVYQFLFIFGVSKTSAGNASLLLSTTPVWAALLSTAAGHERPGPRVWQGVSLAVLGMVLVVAGGEGFRFATDTMTGDLLMVAAAMTWASYSVGSQPLIHRYGAVSVTAWTLWAGTPILVVLGLPDLAATSPGSASGTALFTVGYAGVLAVAVAYLLWNRAVRVLGNSRTAIYSNTVPVVALAGAWLFLSEVPTPLQLAGATVILAGLTLARSRQRAPPPRE